MKDYTLYNIRGLSMNSSIKAVLFLLVTMFSQSVLAESHGYNLNAKNSLTYIMLGQSNMAGQGKVVELAKKQKTLPKNIHFYLNGSEVSIKNQKKFGPEVSFAHAVAAKHPRKLINIIKFAPGGSLMKEWSKKGHYYQTLKKQLQRISKKAALNPTAIFWMQGERDTKSVQLAKTYPAELKELISALRNDLKKPTLAFVIAKISIPEAFRPAVKEIKNAQEKVSKEMPFVKIFATDSLKKNPDKVHFSTQGQLLLGRLFAKAVL